MLLLSLNINTNIPPILPLINLIHPLIRPLIIPIIKYLNFQFFTIIQSRLSHHYLFRQYFAFPSCTVLLKIYNTAPK